MAGIKGKSGRPAKAGAASELMSVRVPKRLRAVIYRRAAAAGLSWQEWVRRELEQRATVEP